MAFEVFKDSTQGAYFVVLIISAVLSVVAVVLRFLATRRMGRKPGLEDWLAVSAVVVFLARIGTVLYALSVINGRGIMLAFDPPAYEKAFKIIFAADVITMLDQTLAKFSICALYYRIFSINRTYRRWIYVLAALQALVYVALVLIQSFQCRPVNKFWQWWAEGECFPFTTILVALEPPNSLVDFALVILALVMIRSLHVKPSAKLKLRILFGLGSLAGLFGFIKIGVSYNKDIAYTNSVLGLWAAVQSLATIICCCAPVYRPLIPETGVWDRLRSKVSSYSLSGRQRSTTTGAGGSGMVHSKEASSRPSAEPRGNSAGGSSSQSSQRMAWLRLDGSSTKGLVWAEPGNNAHAGHVVGGGGNGVYPMGVIQVQRSVDVV